MHIMHIHYFCTYYAYHDFSFPFAGHSDRMNIYKSAAYYALSDEGLATMNLFSGHIFSVFSVLPAVFGSMAC